VPGPELETTVDTRVAVASGLNWCLDEVGVSGGAWMGPIDRLRSRLFRWDAPRKGEEGTVTAVAVDGRAASGKSCAELGRAGFQGDKLRGRLKLLSTATALVLPRRPELGVVGAVLLDGTECNTVVVLLGVVGCTSTADRMDGLEIRGDKLRERGKEALRAPPLIAVIPVEAPVAAVVPTEALVVEAGATVQEEGV